jgi:3'-phosphoadenosine 5'-phosphosulfate sulfotransferase (PAPS reductase)/FAD synthetase
MTDKSRLCGMTQEEVDSYLKENNIKVSVMMELGYDKDGDWAEVITDDEGYQTGFGDDCVRIEKQWGFSGPNGFHTFDFQVDDEVKSQYMTVLFHKLMDEYDVPWVHAEALAYSYVTSDLSVPYVPIEKRLEPNMTEEEQERVRKKLLDCIESGNLVVPKAVDETLFTKSGIIEDWKD